MTPEDLAHLRRAHDLLDQDEALAFYRDGVGLEFIDDVRLDEMRWVTLSSPTQPGAEMAILKNTIRFSQPSKP